MTKTDKTKRPAFDFETSIAFVAPRILKRRNLDLEIYRELFRARKALSKPGARNDLTSKEKRQGWNEYCKRLQVDRSTINGWLEYYDEENDCITELSKAEIEDKNQEEEWEKKGQETSAKRKIISELCEVRMTGTKPIGWKKEYEEGWLFHEKGNFYVELFVRSLFTKRRHAKGNPMEYMKSKHGIEWLPEHEKRFLENEARIKRDKEIDEKFNYKNWNWERVFDSPSPDADRFMLGNPKEDKDLSDLIAGLDQYLETLDNDDRKMDALDKIRRYAIDRRRNFEVKKAANA